MITISLLSPTKLRLKRIKNRKRGDTEISHEKLIERDSKEIDVVISHVIIYSDHYLVNQDKSENEFMAEAKKLLIKIIDEYKNERN